MDGDILDLLAVYIEQKQESLVSLRLICKNWKQHLDYWLRCCFHRFGVENIKELPMKLSWKIRSITNGQCQHFWMTDSKHLIRLTNSICFHLGKASLNNYNGTMNILITTLLCISKTSSTKTKAILHRQTRMTTKHFDERNRKRIHNILKWIFNPVT